MIVFAGFALSAGPLIAADTGAISFVFKKCLGVKIYQALCAVRPVCGCPFLSNDSILISKTLRQHVTDSVERNFKLAVMSVKK